MHLQLKLANQFEKIAPEYPLRKLWENIKEGEGEYTTIGEDAENRLRFVFFQAMVEQAITELAKDGKLRGAVCIIHTPQPPTPMRLPAGHVIEGVVADSIIQKPEVLKTVLNREPLLREYLASGCRLVAAYPKFSIEERAKIPAIDNYDKWRNEHPDSLCDKPFSTIETIASFPKENSGATYLVQDDTGFITCFSILSYQASNPKDGMQWGIWLGSLEKEKVKARFDTIDTFLKEQEIDIQKELEESKKYLPIREVSMSKL